MDFLDINLELTGCATYLDSCYQGRLVIFEDFSARDLFCWRVFKSVHFPERCIFPEAPIVEGKIECQGGWL